MSNCISGTSNWSEDYFSDTAGMSMTLEPIMPAEKAGTNLLVELKTLFERDWNSKLSIPLEL